MSLLVILLPAPVRADAPPAAEPLAWWLSPDGLAITQRGNGAAGWPKADTVVAVAPAESLAWHRPVLPKAPANRLRAALGGLLEEHLLADDEDVHLALAPRAVPGTPTWVAAIHKPWLRARLAALAEAGVVVDRLVPALAPVLDDGGASGHFQGGDEGDEARSLHLAWADADGAVCLPVAGSLARALQPGWLARQARWSATPAAAAAAEQWLGAPVAVRSDAEVALAAARSPWNLLQFDLAPRHRGSLAAGHLWRQLMSPAWAPVRWGALGLLVVQVLGLNALAWQQRSALAAQREAQVALLRQAHPQVRAVLDAPLQMQRETAALRSAAGVPGDDDFETLMAAAATAWPDGQPPAAQLRFETGRLSVPAAGWAPPQVEALRQRLGAAGWALDQADGRLVMRRATPPATP